MFINVLLCVKNKGRTENVSGRKGRTENAVEFFLGLGVRGQEEEEKEYRESRVVVGVV